MNFSLVVNYPSDSLGSSDRNVSLSNCHSDITEIISNYISFLHFTISPLTFLIYLIVMLDHSLGEKVSIIFIWINRWSFCVIVLFYAFSLTFHAGLKVSYIRNTEPLVLWQGATCKLPLVTGHVLNPFAFTYTCRHWLWNNWKDHKFSKLIFQLPETFFFSLTLLTVLGILACSFLFSF